MDNSNNPEPVPATNQAGEVERLRARVAKWQQGTGEGTDKLIRDLAAALATQPATSQEGEVDRSYETLDQATSRITKAAITESLSVIAKAFDDLLIDRDEWRDQHEALLYVRQQDLAALATQPATSQEGEADGSYRHLIDWIAEAREMDQPVYISIAKDGAWHVGTEEKLRRRVADEAFKELRHKLWMVECHATGGGIPEIEGIDRSINDICVQITQSRNAIYQAGKDAVLAATPTPPNLLEDLRVLVEALERQMEDQDENLPSSLARERGLVWLEGWFDLRATLAQVKAS